MAHDIRITWNEIEHEAWEQALTTQAYTAYQQHYAYGDALCVAGRQTQRACIYKGDILVGVVQYAIRSFGRYFSIATALRGPIWLSQLTDEEKAAIYIQLRKQKPYKGLGVCVVMPETDDTAPLCKAHYTQLISGHHTICMDLEQPEDRLLEEMDGKWRNRLMAAQANDMRISQIGKKLHQYSWLLEKETEQAAMVGYKALPASFVPLFQHASNKQALLGLRAEHNGETIGGVLLLLHGNAATYHIGWSNENGKKLGAHNLLLWKAIQALKEKGFRRLDLGGLNTEKESAGVARFKLGLSQRIVKLPGNFIM